MDVVRPIQFATNERMFVDAIVVLTGSHTYGEKDRIREALNEYRSTINKDARLVGLCLSLY